VAGSSDTVYGLFRSIRFALVCLIVGLSFFGIRVAAAIPTFRQMALTMLDGAALPWLTTIVLQEQYVFLATSFLFPTIALGTLFTPIKPRSFYVNGVLALAMIVQTVVVCTALSKPLIGLVDQLNDVAPQSAAK
jgi:hypothetical protein